ncbi:hypothetical protein [Halobacterium jilantaiense]|uniref:DUF8130 domain-containing protein n=1 Tax=Halobacterium jilantaiense TaxID=355548 RepID=A0A1I0N3C6_9EURY|nr:hypothetical protein [Halobacterium jilantaiense]SEV95321.1 hypothetical protein SAMN04487945_0563 [Halobacterium jilantaiense]
MRRRALLSAVASAAALAAGCTSAPTADNTASTTDGQTHLRTVPEPGPDADLAITELSVETEKTAPTHEWYLRIEGVYSTDAVGRNFEDPTVVDVSDIEDEAVREAVERILDEGNVRVDEIPDGLREFVDATDLVTWAADTEADDIATHWTLGVYDAHPDRDPVLAFDVSVLDAGIGEDPAALEFAVENTGDTEQSVYGGVVRPFGIPRVHHPGEPEGASFLLWQDYESIDGLSVTENRITKNAIGTSTPVAPGETLTRTYTLDPSKPQCDAIGPGEWVHEDVLEYTQSGEPEGPGATVDYRLEFTIEDV